MPYNDFVFNQAAHKLQNVHSDSIFTYSGYLPSESVHRQAVGCAGCHTDLNLGHCYRQHFHIFGKTAANTCMRNCVCVLPYLWFSHHTKYLCTSEMPVLAEIDCWDSLELFLNGGSSVGEGNSSCVCTCVQKIVEFHESYLTGCSTGIGFKFRSL